MVVPNVFLAVPSRGSLVTGTASALLQTGRTRIYAIRLHVSSLLTVTFNTLWCGALNERKHGVTHFVMLHDDVVPLDSGWLDVLMREYAASGADVLSTVVPIKDDRGLTSTAFLNRSTRRMRRLTMHETVKLPTTFDARAAGHPECVILPNTGLWVCDITQPWAERICFTMSDRNFKDVDGQWKTKCFGEDWGFGVQLAELGKKVSVTRAVNLVHRGSFDYPNMVGFGTLKEDDSVNEWDAPNSLRNVS